MGENGVFCRVLNEVLGVVVKPPAPLTTLEELEAQDINPVLLTFKPTNLFLTGREKYMLKNETVSLRVYQD